MYIRSVRVLANEEASRTWTVSHALIYQVSRTQLKLTYQAYYLPQSS